MFNRHLSNFLRCSVCMLLYCLLLVQGQGSEAEEAERKLAPKFNQEPKVTGTISFTSRPNEKARRPPVSQNEGNITNKNLNKWEIYKTTQRAENATGTASLHVMNTSFNYALRTVTLIGFSVSLTCHSLVLITYGLFRQLRNVPGLNVMNLCFSLGLSQLVWPIAISFFVGTTVCEAGAILEHYLHKVSFMALTVISYDTYKIFSQPFLGRIATRQRSKFIKYSIFVWLAPAVFVAICVALDKTNVFLAHYGTNCWFGTANATLYFYIMPLSMIMLYNIFKLIQTAVSLSRHYKQTQTIQRRKGKQNLLVCAKLAVLVSCPCFLSFFATLFSDVEELDYLYVVFVCLQGVYIAQMFLLNKRTVNLYKDWWKKGKNVGAGQLKNVASLTKNAPAPLTNALFQLP